MNQKTGSAERSEPTRSEIATLRSLLVNKPERRRFAGIPAHLATEHRIGHIDPYDAGVVVYDDKDFKRAAELLDRVRGASAAPARRGAARASTPRDNTLPCGEVDATATRVSKWGSSLVIRLPASVVEALELHEGDDVEVLVAGARLVQMKKTPGADTPLERLRQYRGKLLADVKFERDDANACA